MKTKASHKKHIWWVFVLNPASSFQLPASSKKRVRFDKKEKGKGQKAKGKSVECLRHRDFMQCWMPSPTLKMGPFGKFASSGQFIHFFPRKAQKNTKKISGAKMSDYRKRRYWGLHILIFISQSIEYFILRVWGFAVKSEIRNTSEIQNSNDPNEHISAAFVHSFTGFENTKLRIWRIGGKIILRVIESEGD